MEGGGAVLSALLVCDSHVFRVVKLRFRYFLCHCERKRSNQQARNPLTKNLQKKRAQSYGEATAQRRFGFCYL